VIYDHQSPVLIPDEDFGRKKIFSVVKYGNNIYSIKVKELKKTNNVLYLYYNSEKLVSNMTWTAAIPLVITANVDFKKVVFIENDIKIGEILYSDY
jgi:hypothetical protein